jgi:quercetin dioxygenase-like cupin family protein
MSRWRFTESLHHPLAQSPQRTGILYSRGRLKFWIDGKEVVVHAGEVLTIPPHMPHQAEAVVDTIALDIFDPPRKDWIEKTDRYLRAKR